MELLIENIKTFEITSNYNHKKINNLFNNSDTISFLELISDHKTMLIMVIQSLFE